MFNCDTCDSTSACQKIRKSLDEFTNGRRLPDDVDKRFCSIAEHLKRSGYDYPKVKSRSSCWLSQRPSVADLYKRELDKLTRQEDIKRRA